jgi:hypothetical protein
MKRVRVGLGSLVLLTLFACGGGGSSTGTTSLTISPDAGDIDTSTSLALTATLSAPGTIVWSVTGGTVTDNAALNTTYTAPTTPGTYEIRATLVENPIVTKSITVIVRTPQGNFDGSIR